MAGTKRERELHRAKLARQQQEEAARAEVRRKRLRIGGAVVGVVLVVALVGGVAVAVNSSSSSGNSTPAASNAPDVMANPTPTVGSTEPASNGKVVKPVVAGCTATTKDSPPTARYPGYTNVLKPGGLYTVGLTTNCGPMTFTLDSANAPQTTSAFIFLTDRGYYNGSRCHRLTTSGIFVLQCGDPTGTGSGSPGFTVPDENLPKATSGGQAIYPRGTIAMANAGSGTTGSQFFIVYKDSPLPPNYNVLGTVTDGLGVVDKVASAGTIDGSTDGHPKQPLEILTAVSTVRTKAKL